MTQLLNHYQKIALLGLVIWLGVVTLQFIGFQQEAWARLVLALAALGWMPLAISLVLSENVMLEEGLRWSIFPAAVLLTVALFLPGGLLAGLLASPWLFITLSVAGRGFYLTKEYANTNVAIVAAHFFLPIGGAWTLADRLGLQPLGFDPAIVLLTSIHFHYAGFIFPLLAGLGVAQFPSVWLKTASGMAVVAVPLTAVGITIAQLWQEPIVEILAAITVTLAGTTLAIGYLKIFFKNNVNRFVQIAWSAMSVALLISMSLALLYALRYWFLIEGLTIPAMRAWHGTLNALVVSGGGLLGWNIWQPQKN
jgi:hypothetical protein